MSHIIEVTQGEKPYRWVRVEEVNGLALTPAAVQLSLTPVGGTHTWLTPDATSQVSTSVVRAALLVDTRFQPGRYMIHARITDAPQIEHVAAARDGLIDII